VIMETGIFLRCQSLDGGPFEHVDISDAPIEVMYSWLQSKDPEFMMSLIMTLMRRRQEYETYVTLLKERVDIGG